MRETPRVVIVGGGFGGLAAAKALKHSPVEVILIDRTNHHLFQPLLYQVATSVLAPGQISSPTTKPASVGEASRLASSVFSAITTPSAMSSTARTGTLPREMKTQ